MVQITYLSNVCSFYNIIWNFVPYFLIKARDSFGNALLPCRVGRLHDFFCTLTVVKRNWNLLHQINLSRRDKQDFNYFACFLMHVILFRTIEGQSVKKKSGRVVLAERRICSPEKCELFQLLGDIRPVIGNCWMNYFDSMMIKLSCLQFKSNEFV